MIEEGTTTITFTEVLKNKLPRIKSLHDSLDWFVQKLLCYCVDKVCGREYAYQNDHKGQSQGRSYSIGLFKSPWYIIGVNCGTSHRFVWKLLDRHWLCDAVHLSVKVWDDLECQCHSYWIRFFQLPSYIPRANLTRLSCYVWDLLSWQCITDRQMKDGHSWR